jgi:hypothetical protein
VTNNSESSSVVITTLLKPILKKGKLIINTEFDIILALIKVRTGATW